MNKEIPSAPKQAGDSGSEMEIIEQRLKSFLSHLQAEFGILDRIVYKNKNQHRRSTYFQYLLKVRRDLRLFQSANVLEILNNSFDVIYGKRPKQKVQLLESLKRKRSNGGKYNFLERLLGVARLLSQMIEPVLKAAIEISTLLARSFFMGFSLTVLALLARIRVLVQQILLDVVCVFNTVSSLSQKEQAVRLSQEGLEVFREYYPIKEQHVSLKCIWQTDKYILEETTTDENMENQERDTGDDAPQGTKKIEYQSIDLWLGVDESGKMNSNHASDDAPPIANEANMCSDDVPVTKNNEEVQVEVGSPTEEPSSKDVLSVEGSPVTSLVQSSNTSKPKSMSKNKVAFVAVKRPSPSTVNDAKVQSKRIKKGDEEKEDPFFSLLTGGTLDSII